MSALDPDYKEKLNAVAKFGIEGNVGLYIGPIILGFAFDCVLLGVMFNQLVHHFLFSPRDRHFNRVILFLSVILAFGSTILNLIIMFDWFAYGFGQWYKFFELRFLKWVPLLDVATVTTIQIFYLERAYQLHGKAKWVIFSVLPFILAGIAGALGCFIMAFKITDSYSIYELVPFLYTWLGATLVADVGLTVIIAYKFIKSRTGWSDTDYLIKKLIAISVETQLPSTITAIAFMLSYGIKPVAGLNIFFELFHPKVYVVAFLSVLNARRALREVISPVAVKQFTYNKDLKRSAGLTVPDVGVDVGVTYLADHSAVVPNLMVDLQRPSGELSRDPSSNFIKEDTIPVSQDRLRARSGSNRSSLEGRDHSSVDPSGIDLHAALKDGRLAV
ncbi:hypothetical protein IAR55_001923 [Kwoniella newhampshirensis]|uniref:DUF6534 domain-containing protein n=1 Tax=Kwoniella newhampshirensis TaxID=1651941 RepID=A0AAW0Z3H4_9TREE